MTERDDLYDEGESAADRAAWLQDRAELLRIMGIPNLSGPEWSALSRDEIAVENAALDAMDDWRDAHPDYLWWRHTA